MKTFDLTIKDSNSICINYNNNCYKIKSCVKCWIQCPENGICQILKENEEQNEKL